MVVVVADDRAKSTVEMLQGIAFSNRAKKSQSFPARLLATGTFASLAVNRGKLAIVDVDKIPRHWASRLSRGSTWLSAVEAQASINDAGTVGETKSEYDHFL